jgi:hypothetical protein
VLPFTDLLAAGASRLTGLSVPSAAERARDLGMHCLRYELLVTALNELGCELGFLHALLFIRVWSLPAAARAHPFVEALDLAIPPNASLQFRAFCLEALATSNGPQGMHSEVYFY